MARKKNAPAIDPVIAENIKREQDLMEKLGWMHGLDGGGYEWSRPGKSFLDAMQDATDQQEKHMANPVCWDDPDLDYIGIQDVVRIHDHACPVLYWDPEECDYSYSDPPVWPASYRDGEDKMCLVATGRLHSVDHECDCKGRLVEWSGAAGEPDEPIEHAKVLQWITDGKVSPSDQWPDDAKLTWAWGEGDEAHPECPKCEGDGTIDCWGGDWAIYALEEIEVDLVITLDQLGHGATNNDRNSYWNILEDQLDQKWPGCTLRVRREGKESFERCGQPAEDVRLAVQKLQEEVLEGKHGEWREPAEDSE